MPQPLNEIRTAYDLAANVYADKFLDELSHKPRDIELLQEFASKVGKGQRVLDLGCGPGHTTSYLASLGLASIGVDLSPEMIATAKSHFPDIQFAVGDFFQLSESNQSVAGILAFYCIVHLQTAELVTVFREIYRVLKFDGVFFLSFHIGIDSVYVDDFLGAGGKLEFFPFPVATVQSALEESGFNDLVIHERTPYETEYPTNRCYVFATK